jgi:hypothetical protein
MAMNAREVVTMPASLLDELLDATREDLAHWYDSYASLDPYALGSGIRSAPPQLRLAWVVKHLSMLRPPRGAA